jgi:ATP-dependent DNA helicase RecG
LGHNEQNSWRSWACERQLICFFLFPRKYQDFTSLHKVSELAHEQLANIVGVVEDIDQMVASSGKHVLFVMVRQDFQHLRAVWFNQPYLTNQFQIGQRVLLRGESEIKRRAIPNESP